MYGTHKKQVFRIPSVTLVVYTHASAHISAGPDGQSI